MVVLLKQMAKQNSLQDKLYIGYDISESMIDLAKEENPNKVIFTTDWDEVKKTIHKFKVENPGKESTLVLSSILHEVFAYCSDKAVDEFFHKIFEAGFDHIAIRDMYTSKNYGKSDPNIVSKIKESTDKDLINEWESRWGSIDNEKSLRHLILTLPYVNDWERESKENYLSQKLPDIVDRFPEQYQISFIDVYTHPRTKDYARETFQFNIDCPTHYKIILSKEKEGNASQSFLHNKQDRKEFLEKYLHSVETNDYKGIQ